MAEKRIYSLVGDEDDCTYSVSSDSEQDNAEAWIEKGGHHNELTNTDLCPEHAHSVFDTEDPEDGIGMQGLTVGDLDKTVKVKDIEELVDNFAEDVLSFVLEDKADDVHYTEKELGEYLEDLRQSFDAELKGILLYKHGTSTTTKTRKFAARTW